MFEIRIWWEGMMLDYYPGFKDEDDAVDYAQEVYSTVSGGQTVQVVNIDNDDDLIWEMTNPAFTE